MAHVDEYVAPSSQVLALLSMANPVPLKNQEVIGEGVGKETFDSSSSRTRTRALARKPLIPRLREPGLISIILRVIDLNYALRVDAPAALMAESSAEQKAAYEKWECPNRISLMIMKGSITTAIRGAIPDSDNAKLYLAHIEEQFQGSSKAHATTLIAKMVTFKYSGSNGVREHFLWMNDMASQVKGLDMKISEESVKTMNVNDVVAQTCGKRKRENENFAKLWHERHISRDKMERLINDGILHSLDFSDFDAIIERIKEKFIKGNERGATHSTGLLKVGAPLPHIEDNDAPEVGPNDVPPIMDPAPIPANEQPLRSCISDHREFDEPKREFGAPWQSSMLLSG
ncbi:hypothetical protein RJ639_031582 [Escallonia herrerae]|uniref:Uncharacterized protein n=1 Tax=Escallonia herrerae TaxID=1293975 RepID=A0AA89BDN2_9ASTE|nr:hypothetical protein RJ639_031582 [Escallonia herrerae]